MQLRRAIMALALAAAMMPGRASAIQVVHERIILDQLGDYNHCQDNGYDVDACQDALMRWVEAHPNDALQAGRMTRAAMQPWVAIPLFVKAFENKTADCRDEDIRLSVVSALTLPPVGNGAVIAQAKKIGFDTCFDDMKSEIIDAAADDANVRQNACHSLVDKRALSGMRLARCQAVK